MSVHATLGADGVFTGDGEVKFNYEDFGVKVPGVLFDAILAGDEATVRFHIVAVSCNARSGPRLPLRRALAVISVCPRGRPSTTSLSMVELAISPRGAKLPAAVTELAAAIEADGGAALAAYQEPIGDHWHLFAMLPIAKVEATPYQRDLSPAHLKRMIEVMKKLDRFTEPIVAVYSAGTYWTPNGNHRRAAAGEIRRQDDSRDRDTRSRSRLSDSRAQHRESAQPARQGARGHPDVSRASRASGPNPPRRISPSSSSARITSRSA